MRRRELLKAGLALGVLPLTGRSPGGQPGPEGQVPPAWNDLVARAEADFSFQADCACERGLDLQLNSPRDAQTWDSLAYLEYAAWSGQPFAQWMLSTRYWEGWRAPRRQLIAVALCYQAAEAGEFIAQVEMALRYNAGCGVLESREWAELWWNSAAHHEIHRPLSELELIEPPGTNGSHRSEEVHWEILHAANRLWDAEAVAVGEPRWHTSAAAEPLAELARLKQSILRAKRLSRPAAQCVAEAGSAGSSRRREEIGDGQSA